MLKTCTKPQSLLVPKGWLGEFKEALAMGRIDSLGWILGGDGLDLDLEIDINWTD